MQKLWPNPLFRSTLLVLFWILLDFVLNLNFDSHKSTQIQFGYYVIGLLASWGVNSALVYLCQWTGRFQRWIGTVLAVMFAAVMTGLVMVNAYLFSFFGEYLFPSALTFVDNDSSYILDYLRTFGGITPALAFLLLLALFFFAFRAPNPAKAFQKSELGFFALALALAIFGIKFMEKKAHFHMVADITSYESLSKFALNVADATPPLHPATRSKPLLLKPTWTAPKTIIVFVNESMGARSLAHLGSSTNGAPRLNARITDSSWIAYTNAITNAGATEVSMPSIFSGVGTHEKFEKLHSIPMLWDLAKARGYKTAYITTQRLRWASLWDFLLKEPIDYKLSIDVSGFKVVHDMGSDDLETMEATRKLILGTPADQPLFLFINTNALHAPFQDHSEWMNLEQIPGTRYEKALALIDSVFEGVFRTLEQSGRYDDALVFITGDHGDTPEPAHKQARVASFYQEIAQMPLLMKLPKHFPAQQRQLLLQNRHQLRQNIDITPTIADYLGLAAAHQQWLGQSLLRPSDTNQIAVMLNTNTFRKWDKEGFALAQGQWRFMCDPNGCRSYNLSTDPGQIQTIPVPANLRIRLDSVINSNEFLSRIYKKYSK